MALVQGHLVIFWSTYMSHKESGLPILPGKCWFDFLIWTYFIMYKTNGSDASSDNLQGLHHKTNNLYENLQLLNDNNNYCGMKRHKCEMV